MPWKNQKVSFTNFRKRHNTKGALNLTIKKKTLRPGIAFLIIHVQLQPLIPWDNLTNANVFLWNDIF